MAAEAEKKESMSQPLYNINIGGEIFSTTEKTLLSHPESTFGLIGISKHNTDAKKSLASYS